MKFLRVLFFPFLFFSFSTIIKAQPLSSPPITINYANPQDYILGGITVSGIEFLDSDALIAITGLKEGDKITIPGEQLSNAIKKLWEQGLIGDVQINVAGVEDNKIFLDFVLKERPRLSRYTFKGIKKPDEDDLKEKMDLVKGRVVNDAMLKNTQKKIRKFYVDKGYYNTVVNIVPEKDSLASNMVILRINIDRKEKIKINEVIIEGNEQLDAKKIKAKMKKVKGRKILRILPGNKLLKKEYDEDKSNIITYYNTQGFRDAVIVSDSIANHNSKSVDVHIKVSEGRKYYFRNITWIGNYIYDDRALNKILNIKKGSIYNQEMLQRRLSYNPTGQDVSSLYLDDGYLFFSVDPVEVLVEGDSIDIEMRMHEGTQATIDKITLSGNTKTHDHVILRALHTVPGQKFSRSDLIRTQQILAQMGYFNAEEIGINPVPNPSTGTVDIGYTVVEKPSDQVQLSGGWGGYYGFVGTVGLVFNNFSIRNFSKFKQWSPLPAGDGQRFSVNLQANGKSYQTMSTSFTEPWLGGKKPHSFTVSLNHSINSTYATTTSLTGPASGFLHLTSLTLMLGKQLKKPDDYFNLVHSVSFTHYNLHNYNFLNAFNQGQANNIYFTNTVSRNSAWGKNNSFPTQGANLSFSVILTPPYSLFNHTHINYEDPTISPSVRYHWVEYNKYMFDNSWFTTLIPGKSRSLVLNVRANFGFISSYRRPTGVGPFERFVMGGSGLSGFNYLLGYDIIGLRGYNNNSIGPAGTGGVAYDKFVFELRYPVMTGQSLSLFTHAFLDAGNNWSSLSQFNPFSVYRSVGMGARIFMPAFGLVGIDYGFPLDILPGYTPAMMRQHRLTFTIGQQLR